VYTNKRFTSAAKICEFTQSTKVVFNKNTHLQKDIYGISATNPTRHDKTYNVITHTYLE